MNASLVSLSVFLSAYLLFIFLPSRRMLIAVCASLFLLLSRTISLKEAFWAVNWNVMGIFIGTLVLADIFMQSRVPAYIAELVVDRAKNTAWAILFICFLTGLISAFVENVATVLIVAPIALALARRLKINPMKMMIALAVSSNLQGTATLIGDPPSMLLGGFARMNFMDFFFYRGRMSIFFAVELGAAVSMLVLYSIFRRHKEKIKLLPVEKVRSWVPSILLVSLILFLAASSFLDTGFSYLAGSICLVFGVLGLIWDKLANKGPLIRTIKTLDWDTAFFLLGVFILVGSITIAGWINVISGFLAGLVSNNLFLGYAVLIFVSVIFSAFVDNVPFLAAMLPVAMSMSAKLQVDPTLFLFGLLIGASLGGNITPIGASANIVACGLLKKEGYAVSFKEFAKVGIPFTLAAVLPASLFIWLIWAK